MRRRAGVANLGQNPRIYVLAGVNGAGKSSLAGAMLSQKGCECFDPDKVAREILSGNPGISQAEANSRAWHAGKCLLKDAISKRWDFVFETTLGGRTITRMLERALSAQIEVLVWYVGLNSLQLHIARVRARVAKGGHPIPVERIRERYDRSRLNLIRLMPGLTELRVFDNSEEADPHAGIPPRPKLLLHFVRGKIHSLCALSLAPDWVKPILAMAMKLTSVS